jgi:hypothetical protein
MTGPPIENAARWGPEAALEGIEKNRNNVVTIHGFSARQNQGLFAVEFCRAIRAAIDRESRLNIPPDALEGISSAWEGRVP